MSLNVADQLFGWSKDKSQHLYFCYRQAAMNNFVPTARTAEHVCTQDKHILPDKRSFNKSAILKQYPQK